MKGQSLPAGAGLTAARQVGEALNLERGAFLNDLEQLVHIDSPSTCPRSLEMAADFLAEYFSPIGTVHRVGDPPSLLIDVGNVGSGRAPLILCHYDTVWPNGTASRWPMSIEGNWVTGPGVLDMKGSVVLVHHVLRTLTKCDYGLARGARLLISCDEEILNPSSGALIAEVAENSGAALVVEPPLPDGQLKTERKGYALARYDIRGRAAHAGIEPQKGVSAIVEAAHLTLAAHRLNDEVAGTSVNVGVVTGGERPNVVAPTAELQLEVRACRDDGLERTLTELMHQSPELPGASVDFTLLARRSPMPRTTATAVLFNLASEIAEGMGVTLREASTGGVSEGNITQAASCPTLDGLGLVGIGPHTPAERFHLDSLGERAGLLSGLLVALSDATDDDLLNLRQTLRS